MRKEITPRQLNDIHDPFDLKSSKIQDLENKLNRAHRELSILYEVSNAMRTTLELNRILYIILTGVTSHTGLKFNRAVLFLLNPQEMCLEPKMALGPESGEHAEKIWGYISDAQKHFYDLIAQENINENTQSSSLFQSVAHLKIPVDGTDHTLLAKAFSSESLLHITKDMITEQYAQDPFFQSFHTNELIIVPLRSKDKVNGLIIADNYFTQKPITQEDYKIFTMLATQAGLAIDNSRLYEETEFKSQTDAITALWNHGYFQKQLEREIKDPRKTGHPVSLLILDIDNFKKFNDSYGHQSGDFILKKIAAIIKDSSRDIDFVCRYGGEEFSIILTQTNQEQGLYIAERLRQKIQDHRFNLSVTDHPAQLSVSIGLATFPVHAQSKDALILKADKAMYKAKYNGKNQTCIAD
jgi:diguanylate cyclase (GGDEF)-like protein